MLYVIYGTEKAKQIIQQHLNNSALKLGEYAFIPQSQLNEDNLYTVFDRANALIIQVNGDTKKSLALVITARIAGIPVVAINTNQNRIINKMLKMYSLDTIDQALRNLAEQISRYANPASMLNFKSDVIKAEETGLPGQIHYVHSTSSRPPLIFYHGITARSVTYYKLLQRLQEKYQVFALDLPLHGKSYNPHKIESIYDIIRPAIVASLHIMAKHKLSMQEVTLMGHSLGGAVVLDFLTLVSQKRLPEALSEFKLPARLQLQSPKNSILITPAGLPINNNRALLTLKSLLTRVQLISDYMKQAEAVRKGIGDQLLYSIEKIFDSPIPIIALHRKLIEIVPQGLNNLPTERLTTNAHIAFANQDPFFDCDYKLRFLQLFETPKLTVIPGYHDFPITHPERVPI